MALDEYSADPETWQAPLTKALIATGALSDQAVIEAGGKTRLGPALDEMYEDGPGLVQQFEGGSSGQAGVICALDGHDALAVAQEVWSALAQFGRGTYLSGVAAVGLSATPATGARHRIEPVDRSI